MGRFPDALRTALAERGWSQSELARRSKAVNQSTIGRYLAGTDLPKPGTLDSLCEPFPVEVREGLTAAYLTEHIPASVRERVKVSIVQENGEPPVELNPEQPMPGSELERILHTLGREAIRNPNLFHILDHLAAPLEGRKPLMEQERQGLTVFTVEEQARIAAAEEEVAAQERAAGETPKPRRTRYTKRKTDDGA